MDGTVSASNCVLTGGSDERLKNLCGTYCEGYCVINKLKPIKYDWKDPILNKPGQVQIGFTAQNVQTAIPEAVSENKDGYLGLYDRPIIAALVNTIKELKTEYDSRLDEQDNKIEQLQNELNSLK